MSTDEPLFSAPPSPPSTSPAALPARPSLASAVAGTGPASLDDYKRLNRRATQWGMYAGVAGGGVLGWAAHRSGRGGKNGATLAFLLGGTTVSYLTSHYLLSVSLASLYAAPALPIDALSDLAAPSPAPGPAHTLSAPPADAAPAPDDARAQLTQQLRGLQTVGKQRERTRWAKGVGLDGEVEEEGEMRDTWFRPGIPRREA
ncbi:hypothetical protein Q5752_002825 [Cryptotrichosporon argae]